MRWSVLLVVVAEAGKHVICTKPLAAYVGQDLEDPAIAGATDPETMRDVAVDDAREMVDAAARAGVQLCYGENWIYAQAVPS